MSALICLAHVTVAALLTALPAAAGDRYRSFEDLARHEREGVDYRVTVRAGAGPAVLAIHGGGIEPGTSEVARAIAGDDLALYLFEGIKPRGNQTLHVTSSRFDEPRGVKLASDASACVSIHGFLETTRAAVCIGGDNRKMGLAISAALRSSGLGLEVQYPCDRYEGVKPGNILQRCRESGAQLELSTALRDSLKASPERLRAFARAVREALAR